MKIKRINREVTKTALIYKLESFDVSVKPTSTSVKGRNIDYSY